MRQAHPIPAREIGEHAVGLLASVPFGARSKARSDARESLT